LHEAVRLNGEYPRAFYNLGMAQTNDAIIQLTHALKIKPDFVAVRNTLDQIRTP